MRHVLNAGRRSVAFTLIELLVVVALVAMVMAIAFPVMNRLHKSTAQTQFRAKVLASLQANIAMLNTFRGPDADKGAPRISGGTYGGTLVVFDRDRALMRFANNNQSARDNAVTNPNDSQARIEAQKYLWDSAALNATNTVPTDPKGLTKKAYDILKQVEPVAIPDAVGMLGLVRDDNGTPLDPSDDKLKLVRPPFAVCCGADAYGLPISPAVFVDLSGNGTYQQVPSVLPAVVVYMRTDLEDLGVQADSVTPGLPNLNSGKLSGLTDEQKVNLILGQKPQHGHGQLVMLALQNGAEIDTP